MMKTLTVLFNAHDGGTKERLEELIRQIGQKVTLITATLEKVLINNAYDFRDENQSYRLVIYYQFKGGTYPDVIREIDNMVQILFGSTLVLAITESTATHTVYGNGTHVLYKDAEDDYCDSLSAEYFGMGEDAFLY